MIGTLTLFSDASYDHRTKAAGWAAWCKSDQMKYGKFFSGAFRSPITRASEAELCGIVNAVSTICDYELLDDIEHVMIQCDSIHALSVIYHLVPGTKHNPIVNPRAIVSKSLPTCTELERTAAARLARMTPHLEFSVRHVKGHSRRLDGRSGVNRECDRLAKDAMRKRMLELRTRA